MNTELCLHANIFARVWYQLVMKASTKRYPLYWKTNPAIPYYVKSNCFDPIQCRGKAAKISLLKINEYRLFPLITIVLL